VHVLGVLALLEAAEGRLDVPLDPFGEAVVGDGDVVNGFGDSVPGAKEDAANGLDDSVEGRGR
jgi:hypothetical protein